MSLQGAPRLITDERNAVAGLGVVSRLMNVGLLVIDASKGIAFASGLALTLLGCSNEAELQERWPRLRSALGLDVLSPGGQASPIRRAVDLPLCSGATRPLRLEVHESPGTAGALVLLRDRQASDLLESDLLLASRMRSLVHVHRVLAHDLKAPLNAMQLTLELLGDPGSYAGMPDGESRRRRHVEVLREELARLNRILQTMLDQNEPLDATSQLFDVRELIREIVVLLAPQARAQRVELAIRLPDAALWMPGYRDRVKQALLNIAINRLESMPHGGRLQVALDARETSAVMTITDTGARIPDALLGEMSQICLTTQESACGTGLYVARLVIESHGGDIALESGPNQGTRFTVRLPLRGNAAGIPIAAGAFA
ncbi:MAG TPA: HAMP domain-containing sensor histidine kinase [Burkholderiales bacterium]|nr:HAMP domain-containing sensor histidine kinase [Burkholderiales bacterium]